MGALQSISYRNVRGNYFLALEKRTSDSWINDVASMFSSDQPLEIYKFLGNIPNMQKWAGERRRLKLKDQGITVLNDKFESTIEVDIDDMQMDKTGQIMARVSDLGAAAAVLPERLLTDLITANGTAYDGVALFGSHTAWSTANTAQTLAGTSTPDAPSSASMSAAILNAITAMYGFTDENGEPLNSEARQFTVMVPTKYWGPAVAALQNDFTSAGVSNTLKNIGVQIKLAVNPRLSGAAAAAGRRFYVFRTDAQIKSLIWQDRDVPDAFKTLDANSENGFWKDTVAFGAKRVGGCGPGRFELACRMELQA